MRSRAPMRLVCSVHAADRWSRSRCDYKESHHDLISLFEHDLFGKPVSTFPDHALLALRLRHHVAAGRAGAGLLVLEEIPVRLRDRIGAIVGYDELFLVQEVIAF